MKKVFFLAVAFLAAAACTRESVVPEEPETEQYGPFQVTLVAGGPETRTELGYVDEKLKPFWSVGDNIEIIRIPNFNLEEDFEMDDDGYPVYHTFSSELTSSSLSAEFSGYVNQTGQYRAFYPNRIEKLNSWGDLMTEGPSLEDGWLMFDIPTVQYPSATSFDNRADLLVSAPFEIPTDFGLTVGLESSVVPVSFTRVNAIVKVKFNPTGELRNLLAGQKVRKVGFNTLSDYEEGEEKKKMSVPPTRVTIVDNEDTDIGLTGSVRYYLPHASIDDYDVNKTDSYMFNGWYEGYVVARYTDETAYDILSDDDEIATYFIVFPSILKNYYWDEGDSYEGLYIMVETDDYIIRREVKLPSTGIALQPSVVTTLNIGLTEDNVLEILEKGISLERTETTLVQGDGEFVNLDANVITFPRYIDNVPEFFQEHFSVSAVDDQNEAVAGISISAVPDEANGDPYTEVSYMGESIDNLYLSVAAGVPVGTYEVTITYDGRYSATCTVNVISSAGLPYIIFADAKVKEICVDNWGGHYVQGELTYYEASKVTTIISNDNWRSFFKDNTEIETFDEFQYFTGLKAIEYNAFEGCTKLKSIIIPETVTMIQDPGGSCAAFRNCEKLESVGLPQYLEAIGESAFENCKSLTTITLPASVQWISSAAFKNCTDLTTFVIPANSQLYAIHGSSDYWSGSRDGAFTGCKALKTITLPPSLKTIGEYAFYECESLTSLSIPNGVTSIDSYAFAYCEDLGSVSIPSSVSVIPSYAFYCCYQLSEVDLPASVASIGQYAFAYCQQLTGITVRRESVPSGATNMFYGTNDCPIYVPAGSVSDYQSASYWSTYSSRIQAISE